MSDEQLSRKLEAASYRFAYTMPENPHWYTLRSTWDNDQDFIDCVLLIRRTGREVIFWNKPYVQLAHNGWDYWTMGAPTEETILINRNLCH